MRILNAKEAAEFLGIHISTLYEKIKDGQIPAGRVGRRWKFPQEMLEDWLNDNVNKLRGKWKQTGAAQTGLKVRTHRLGEMSNCPKEDL